MLLHPGASYSRWELHAGLGGQPEDRISLSPDGLTIMLFASAGDEAQNHWGDDGFYHFSEQAPADSTSLFERQQAIIEHAQGRRRLALFTPMHHDRYRFSGYMNYVDHHCSPSPAPPERRTTFRLVTSVMPSQQPAEASQSRAPCLTTQREQAYMASDQDACLADVTDYQQRSVQVARYVQARAGGFCEGCGLPAPFEDGNGVPYLETHHLNRLDDNAPDPPTMVATLCPTCHQRAHHAVDAEKFSCAVAKRVESLEHAADGNEQLRVVAAILISEGDRIFIAQRDSGQLSGYWEFPGGKVEANETLLAALKRELREELGISIEGVAPFMRVDHRYACFHLRLFAFIATTKERPFSTEHRQTRWVARSELERFNWAPADEPIVAALQTSALQAFRGGR